MYIKYIGGGASVYCRCFFSIINNRMVIHRLGIHEAGDKMEMQSSDIGDFVAGNPDDHWI